VIHPCAAFKLHPPSLQEGYWCQCSYGDPYAGGRFSDRYSQPRSAYLRWSQLTSFCLCSSSLSSTFSPWTNCQTQKSGQVDRSNWPEEPPRQLPGPEPDDTCERLWLKLAEAESVLLLRRLGNDAFQEVNQLEPNHAKEELDAQTKVDKIWRAITDPQGPCCDNKPFPKPQVRPVAKDFDVYDYWDADDWRANRERWRELEGRGATSDVTPFLIVGAAAGAGFAAAGASAGSGAGAGAGGGAAAGAGTGVIGRIGPAAVGLAAAAAGPAHGPPTGAHPPSGGAIGGPRPGFQGPRPTTAPYN
jgi:hypothetical protein